MPKGYILAAYREVRDPAKVAAYARLAAPAVEEAGGRYLARGQPTQAHEAGLRQRTAIIEFPTLHQAVEFYENPAYREALAQLGDGAERDIRIMEGTE